MTTSVTIINHGPFAVRVQAYDERTGNNIDQPRVVESERIASHQTLYFGRSYKIEEDGPMQRAKIASDSDIIEYGTVRGEQRTYHGREHLDVEVNSDGEVVAVWFRCACLPFKQINVDTGRSIAMRDQQHQIDKFALMAVTLRSKT